MTDQECIVFSEMFLSFNFEVNGDCSLKQNYSAVKNACDIRDSWELHVKMVQKQSQKTHSRQNKNFK